MKERLYFTWEEGPAVIDPVDAGYLGFFISPGNADWTLAEPSQVADFFVDGLKMSESDFNNKFGGIGSDLPELPDVT